MPAVAAQRTPPGPKWLENAIIYQIYPASFQDSNGDGIGDLGGIISRLDYIRSLGCDVLWLTPCFDSPFGDGGYDIRDFYKIAPRYGTEADLRRLFREARRRGLRVILDLVAGHTSAEHAWFRDSARTAANPMTHRYIWTDSAWKGPGPGLEGIRGHSDRDGQYVTNFFHFQPALNYGFARPDPRQPWQLPVDHPDVLATRRELLAIMRHWLDMGADGFRVDMAFSLVKNDPGGRATMDLWRDIRARWEKTHPDAALLSEWSVPERAIPAGFHVDFMIHFGTPAYTGLFRAETARDAFATDPAAPGGRSFFDRAGRGDITAFLDIYQKQLRRTRAQGYISLPTGNHDITRLAKGRTEAELKVAFAFLLTQPGIPCIYYGDEIGMAHLDGLPSKEGGYGRTGARTPMQWTAGRNAGFSTAPARRLYLPVDSAPGRPSVDRQERDPASLLNTVRALAALRRASPAFRPAAPFKPLHAKKRRCPFVYQRGTGPDRHLVVVNPSAEAATLRLRGLLFPGALRPVLGDGVEITRDGGWLRIHAAPTSWSIHAPA